MNTNTLYFKPKMAWNKHTHDIFQKIERGLDRLHAKCYDTLPDLINTSSPNSKNSLLDELDNMLLHVNTINADIKRLQILKVWFCAENATIISNLLQNNSYLNYNEEQLEKIIQVIA